MGSAVLVVAAVVAVFGLTGADRSVLRLLGVAPVGFVTVTFASLEGLDVQLATAALSLSLPVSLVLSLGVAALAH